MGVFIEMMYPQHTCSSYILGEHFLHIHRNIGHSEEGGRGGGIGEMGKEKRGEGEEGVRG